MDANLPPLYGLILAGGQSKRMGKEKADLVYVDRPQHEITAELLSEFCEHTYFSTRKGQKLKVPQTSIADRFGPIGPMGGLLSAWDAHPGVAWLAVGCDMPFLDDTIIEHIVEARDSSYSATAYVSVRDGQVEPLCCIYEPSMQAELSKAREAKRYSLRDCLKRTRFKTLELMQPDGLDSVNTPGDYAKAKRRLQS